MAAADDRKAQSNQDSQSEQAPQDAASLVIFRRSANGVISILMGRRHPDNAFLPNKYVFPGGRFDPADSTVNSAGQLSDGNLNVLSLSVADHSRDFSAFALTAIRETFEETGIVIGQRAKQPQSTPSPGWQRFFDTGHSPDPSNLTVFARAITPPGRARRYDTRFFCVGSEQISAQVQAVDEELLDICWVNLENARDKDVASITRHILSDVARLIRSDGVGKEPREIPFYFYENTGFQRVLLSHHDSTA